MTHAGTRRLLPSRVARGLPVLAAVLAVLLSSACAPQTTASPGSRPSPSPTETTGTAGPALLIVAELPPLADLARQVVGEHGEVRSLVPDGADSHTFEPRPTDARTVGEADLVLLNGLGLNSALDRLAESNVRGDTPIIRLADEALDEDELVVGHAHGDEGTHSHGGDDDRHSHAHDGDDPAPNPHAWLNVEFAARYLEAIADALAAVDPDHQETYRDNARAHRERLMALDRAIAAAVGSIPSDDRKLVTYHDSWSYFGPRYGLEVVAAVQPADFSQPSAAEIRRIVDQIQEEDIPAVFGSEVFPSDVLEVISEETGARYVPDLADDELPGDPGAPEHTYIGMMARNARIIVEALGGDTSALDRFDPAARP